MQKRWTFIFLLNVMLALSASKVLKAEEQQLLAVVHARLVDGTGAPPVENATVLIEEGRISAVGRGAEVEIPDGATTLDAKGRTVVPGLIDSHYHMNYPNTREQPFILDESLCSFRASYHLRRQCRHGQ